MIASRTWNSPPTDMPTRRKNGRAQEPREGIQDDGNGAIGQANTSSSSHSRSFATTPSFAQYVLVSSPEGGLPSVRLVHPSSPCELLLECGSVLTFERGSYEQQQAGKHQQ